VGAKPFYFSEGDVPLTGSRILHK